MARNDKKKSPEQAELTAADDLESAYSGENGEEDFLSDGAFTLESILAEYKGSAYIEGDKRTPAEVLQQRTDRIIQEAGVGRFERGAPVEAPEESYGRGPARTPDDEKVKTGKLPSLYGNRGKLPKLDGNTARLPGTDTARLPKTDTAGLARTDTLRLPKTDTKRLPVLDTQRPPKGKPDAGVPDIGAVNRAKSLEYESAQIGRRESAVGNDVAARDAQLSPDAAEEEIIRDITAAIEQQTQFEQETQKAARKAFGIFRRKGYDAEDEGDETEYEPEYEAPEVIEDVYVEEPEPAAAIRRFAEKCNMYSTRFVASLAVSVLLAILTAVFQTGVKLPFGIGYNPGAASGILLILLFVVMMFSAEKLVDGVTDIIKGRQGIETLNLFSCLATASAAVYGMLTGSAEAGMPFCAVSAFSLTFTLWGERVYYRALTETLKTAHAAAVPTGLVVTMCEDLNRSVIKKTTGLTDGFYNNLVEADITETIFKYAAPVLIVASLVLAFFSSVGQGQNQHFMHNFAAVMASAAPFSAVLAYAAPFNTVTRRARQSGVAVAGWGGADELFHSDGASIKDEDIFPAGTVTLSGIKIFEEIAPDKALRYTASLIIASRSVLSSLFTQLLTKEGLTKLGVDDFMCYEGGIGGTVKGERVVTGSAALMNLQGIRVPPSLNMKNGVFTAIDKKLIAVFTIDYVPVKTVQNAMISVLRHHVRLLFSVRDFNITPVMLEQKFKVPVDDVEYIPIQDSYDLSDDTKLDTKRTAAILTREGIGPYVEAIISGRRLRLTSLVATILTLLTAAGGMIIMYTICMTGAFDAGSAANLLLYMVSMTVIVLIVSGFARYTH